MKGEKDGETEGAKGGKVEGDALYMLQRVSDFGTVEGRAAD